MALNSLSELPLMGPLSGVKQTPLWQPPETAFNLLQMCTAVARNTPTSDLSSVLVGFVIQRFRQL